MPQLSYSNGTTNVPARTFWMSKDVVVHQERGVSKADVMSQSAVTHELELLDTQIYNIIQEKLNKSEAEQVYLKSKDAENLYQPVGDYALKSDIPVFDLKDYLLKSELPTKVSVFENDAEYLTNAVLQGNYYTITEITEIVSNLKADSENWLHNFYDKDQINELLKKAKEEDSNLHNDYDNRLKQLEAINHDNFALKSDLPDMDGNLSGYVKKDDFNTALEDIYTKEETDKAITDNIEEAVSGFETIAGAEEKYQPKGDYLTDESLNDYAKKDEVTAEISEAVTGINISSYLTKTEAEEEYQPKGDYLTEHQSLEDYMTVEQAEKEHKEIKDNINLIDERLKIAENLCAAFETFDSWQLGYYAEDDFALENKLEHDGCYYIIADVSNCRTTDFFAHFAPNSYNKYIFEYSGLPSTATYLKRTKKEQFDLTFTLDSKTKYVVAFAYVPVLPVAQYYLRGIKITDEDSEHVTFKEFNQLEQRVTVLEEEEGNGNSSYDDTQIKADIKEIQSQLSGIDELLNEILGE